MININKITEAIESLIQRAKNELVGHIDAKHQETMGMKGLINEILKKLGENEQKMAEMKSIMTEKNNEIAQLKLKVEELQKSNGASFSELMTKIDTIGDSIPQEIKQARLKQNEARVKEKLELQKPESADEKPNYEAMANQIYHKLSSSDVIIEENLPSEVIQKLLVKEDVTVNFIDGHIVVAKKSEDLLVDFDRNAIIKEYQEMIKLNARIKYDSVLSKQMAFIEEKVREQIALFKKNPYRYESVELSGSPAENPMYMEVDGYINPRFVMLDEIMKYLLKYGMVMEFVPTDRNQKVAITNKEYYDIYFLADKAFQLARNSNIFDQHYDCYVPENFIKVKLHVLSEAEKVCIENLKNN